MNMFRSRYEQLYDQTSKLQSAIAEIQQQLQKLIKLSNPKDNHLKLAQNRLKIISKKQGQTTQVTQNLQQFEQEEMSQGNNYQEKQDNKQEIKYKSTYLRKDGYNQRKEQPQTNKHTQILLDRNTSSKVIPLKINKTKHKLVIPKPKAPLSPFFLFMRQKRDIVKQQYPTLPPNHITKIFGMLWKALTPQQRKPYYDTYARSQSNYMNFIAKIGHKINES